MRSNSLAGNIWCEGVGNFAPDLPDVRPGARIGLLGGSFDPAHEGHVAISLRAMRQARLDWVWWMVTPQNPLKDTPSASLRERLERARRFAGHPLRCIWVSDIEIRLRTRYTVDAVRVLRQRYSHVQFVLLMGSDILTELPRWSDWRELTRLLPLLVAPRTRSLISMNCGRRGFRIIPPERAYQLVGSRPPAVCFLSGTRLSVSSTRLRGLVGSEISRGRRL